MAGHDRLGSVPQRPPAFRVHRVAATGDPRRPSARAIAAHRSRLAPDLRQRMDGLRRRADGAAIRPRAGRRRHRITMAPHGRARRARACTRGAALDRPDHRAVSQSTGSRGLVAGGPHPGPEPRNRALAACKRAWSSGGLPPRRPRGGFRPPDAAARRWHAAGGPVRWPPDPLEGRWARDPGRSPHCPAGASSWPAPGRRNDACDRWRRRLGVADRVEFRGWLPRETRPAADERGGGRDDLSRASTRRAAGPWGRPSRPACPSCAWTAADRRSSGADQSRQATRGGPCAAWLVPPRKPSPTVRRSPRRHSSTSVAGPSRASSAAEVSSEEPRWPGAAVAVEWCRGAPTGGSVP